MSMEEQARMMTNAARDGDIDTVRALLQTGVPADADEHAALRIAVENGEAEITRLLLDNGADVHICNEFCLLWAARNGHVETVRVLLDYGAKVEGTWGGEGAVTWATHNGHAEVLELLETSKTSRRTESQNEFMAAFEANPTLEFLGRLTDHHGGTRLIQAAKEGLMPVVMEKLGREITVEALTRTDEGRMSALRILANRDDLDCVMNPKYWRDRPGEVQKLVEALKAPEFEKHYPGIQIEKLRATLTRDTLHKKLRRGPRL